MAKLGIQVGRRLWCRRLSGRDFCYDSAGKAHFNSRKLNIDGLFRINLYNPLCEQTRWLRGSRFRTPRTYQAFDDETDGNTVQAKQEALDVEETQIRSHEGERFKEQVRPSEIDPSFPETSKKGRRKFIKDAAVYGDSVNKKQIGDPFMTGPYVKEANISFRYDQGNSALEEAARLRIEPSSTSIIMFPGQGTQYVGMCGAPTESMKYMFDVANTILGYDLRDVCMNGPAEKLNRTYYCQPAIFLCSLAATDNLRLKNKKSIESCVAAAGFSIGEIAALVFGGVLSFEDGVRLVKVRAEAMDLASQMVPSGMATVLMSADSKLNYALLVAKEWCKREFGMDNPVCSIANHLFPHCKVIGGHLKALEFLELNYKDFNLRKVKRLPVSGAFHTELMKPAAEPLKALLNHIVLNKPYVPIYSNVTGRRYSSTEEIKKNLIKQIYRPVCWEQTLQAIYLRPKDVEQPNTFECGPGSSLSTILKQVNAKAHAKCSSVNL